MEFQVEGETGASRLKGGKAKQVNGEERKNHNIMQYFT